MSKKIYIDYEQLVQAALRSVVKEALTQAAKSAGATLLGLITHKFEPQGVTGVALLSESHLSFHSWPEYGYASIDAFTCGDHTDPEAACHSLKYAFKATHGSIRLLRREGPTFNHPRFVVVNSLK